MYNQSILKAFWKKLAQASWDHGQERYFYFQWFWLLGGRYFWYYNWLCFQGWWLMVFKISKWLLTNLGTVTSISQMDAFLSTAYLQALETNSNNKTKHKQPRKNNSFQTEETDKFIFHINFIISYKWCAYFGEYFYWMSLGTKCMPAKRAGRYQSVHFTFYSDQSPLSHSAQTTANIIGTYDSRYLKWWALLKTMCKRCLAHL